MLLSRPFAKTSFFVGLYICLSSLSAIAEEPNQQCDEKACFNSQISRDEVKLSLRSSSLFQYLFFDVSTVALYTDNESSDVLADTPKSLQLHYHRTISREQMIENTSEHFALNPDVNIADYQQELQQLFSWYQNVTDGDLYELNYLPGKGLSLYFNGTLMGTISSVSAEKSARFARDFFGLWFSKYTFCQKTRDDLLRPRHRTA